MNWSRRYLKVPDLNDDLRIPYAVIDGDERGPRLTVLAGIHGCEYTGMAAAREFITQIAPAQVTGSMTIVPIVNLPAFRSRTPFVTPQDGKNLNRCFPGDRRGSYSERLAYHVFESFIRSGDYLVDLHAGDLPESAADMTIYDESAVESEAGALARAFGALHVIRQPRAARIVEGSAIAAAADVGIPAIVSNSGGNGLVDPVSVERHLRGLRNVCGHLGVFPFEIDPTPGQVEHSSGWDWLRTPIGGWWRPKVRLGRYVEAGELLGLVTDPFGDLLHELRAPEPGVPVFVTSPPAVAENDLLVAIARVRETSRELAAATRWPKGCQP